MLPVSLKTSHCSSSRVESSPTACTPLKPEQEQAQFALGSASANWAAPEATTMQVIEVIEDLGRLARCESPLLLVPSPLITVAAVAAPHFLYAFIWFKPKAWMRWFPNNAVDAFASAGLLGKLLQFAAVLLWFASLRDNGVCLAPAAISLPQWLAFLLLVGFGQSLNVGIFQAIGHAGVYYGFKLGHKIPWVTGWPFDSVAHPQYFGSVLTVWGLLALACGQAPGGPLLTLAAYWTAVYFVTALQEQFT